VTKITQIDDPEAERAAWDAVFDLLLEAANRADEDPTAKPRSVGDGKRKSKTA
jgi:hypothetical protein